jgi:asparagine synthase (glutamine-hydrolysing)
VTALQLMSGIVGIFNLDGAPVSKKLLTSMTASLSFRGPDGTSEWLRENVGFGHALLRTNQGSDRQQPVTLEGQIWLTGHARIDGRRELLTELGKHFQDRKVSFQTNPDSFPPDGDLILMAYKIWGEECVAHLIGDFSFAIWDSRKGQLFCARDQMGVGQFYYARKNGCFVFSNTLNCLRSHPEVSATLNDVALGDYLLFGLNHDKTTTIYTDIQRLPRAHSLTVTSDAVRTKEYLTLRVNNVRYKSNSDYVERFKELLDTAVADRLRSTKVGVAMSGGLDSSMIAASADSGLKLIDPSSELRAYCVVYDGAFPDDERTYATQVARSLKIPVYFLEGDQINSQTSKRTLGFAPEPFDVEPFYVASDELLRQISTTSRVGLTGWDGDTFMSESPKYLFHDLWRTRSFGKLANELMRYVYYQKSPPPVGIRTWWKTRHLANANTSYPVWINQEFAQKTKLAERWRENTSKSSLLHSTRPHAFRNLNTPHWDALFSRFDSGVTGLPLEVRHPLIDPRLVEFLLGLPIIPWLIGKHILREAARGILPEPVRRRRKTTLTGDPGQQLRYSTKAKEIDSFVPTPEILNYIKREAVPPLTTESDSDSLWANARPFSLNQWLRHSYNVDTTFSEEHQHEGHRQYSQNSAARSAQTTLHAAEVSQLR